MSKEDEYDECLMIVSEMCEPIKEKINEIFQLSKKYSINETTIYKEMFEPELYGMFCEKLYEENK